MRYPPRQFPQCALLVCEKFAENPEFRVGNFAVNLKREISHANLKCHENPPPPPVHPCLPQCHTQSMPCACPVHAPRMPLPTASASPTYARTMPHACTRRAKSVPCVCHVHALRVPRPRAWDWISCGIADMQSHGGRHHTSRCPVSLTGGGEISGGDNFAGAGGGGNSPERKVATPREIFAACDRQLHCKFGRR